MSSVVARPTSFEDLKQRVRYLLEAADVGRNARHDLHHPQTIVVEPNKEFGSGYKTNFALRIGTLRGTAWACMEDGTLIDENEGNYGRPKKINSTSNIQIKFSTSNKWPPSLRDGINGPLRGKLLALAHFDIVRWAAINKPNGCDKIIQPDIDELVVALKLYGLGLNHQVGKSTLSPLNGCSRCRLSTG
jgi:hypothetical protein